MTLSRPCRPLATGTSTKTVGNGDLNVALLIKDNAPERIKAAVEERDKLIERVRELNFEIALLQTHVQVGSNLELKREVEGATGPGG